MIIESINYNEKKDLFEVDISGDLFLLEYKDIERFTLSSGQEIKSELYKEIIQLDSYTRAKEKIFRYVTSNLRTSKSIKDKLYRAGFNRDTIEMVISFYKDLGFINDMFYAEEYSKNLLYSKHESIKKTRYKLLEKGISVEIVNRIIQSIPSELDTKNLIYQYNRKYKNENMDIREKQKAIRFLQYKGFSYNDIKKVIKIEF